MSILESFKLDDYRWGQCQAVVYDRNKTQVFPPGFLSRFYFQFLGDRYSKKNSTGTGILKTLFCGMKDVSHDAVVQYWMTHPTVILGVWDGDVFKPAGCCFPSMMIGAGEDERAAFCGYGYTREWWGSDEQDVLTVLGITIMFSEMNLVSMHGMRFVDNEATARYMARFGFVDVATLPRQMIRDGKLVDEVISTVTRETFERVVEKMVLDAYVNGKEASDGE